MSVTLHPGRLRLEMTRRGWDATDLARAARLSNATVSSALHGRSISATSVALIAKALAEVAPDPVIDALILGERPAPGLE